MLLQINQAKCLVWLQINQIEPRKQIRIQVPNGLKSNDIYQKHTLIKLYNALTKTQAPNGFKSNVASL